MSTSETVGDKAASENGGRLIGYAECHFCSVRKKRRSLRCIRCVGRLTLRERTVQAAEAPARRRLAAIISLFVPGLGHAYRTSPGTGLFYFAIIAIAATYFIVVEGEMTSGRWVTVGALFLVYVVTAVDAGRKKRESKPPCQEACPAGLACSLYAGLAREGKFREALELIQSLCPFPGTVGRVCHHPCEQSCRRGETGDPIAICALKRFLADESTGEAETFTLESEQGGERFEEKVAVVGGGPSGLSAALYLHLLGFQVTLFEAGKELGGMPQAVIPDYRLPAFIYREEIKNVLALGIEVRTEKRLGEDFSFRDLEGEGFSALYLALGAQRTVRLPHCGTREEGFLDGIEFLREAKSGKAERLHGHVIVIGGGNVAVDVAKTAVRLGGEKVSKVFLETKETMPAHHWECEEAVEEGVNLVPASSTISFEKKDGRVASALCRKVERIEFDENRRIRPVFEEGSDFTLQADWVITAVGTGPDYSILPEAPKLKPVHKGARAGRFSHPDLPAFPIVIGGDYFAGPASVIEAIAAGYEGALDIYRLLHKFSFFRLPVWNRIKPIRYPGYLDDSEKARRIVMAKVDPEVRCESFCEVCEAYSGKAAENEAARCLRCNWPMFPVTVRRKHPEVTQPVEEPAVPETGRFV